MHAQVLFHPEQPTTLLSASEDGNAAVFNLSGGWDEEAAFRVRRTLPRNQT